MVSHSQTSRDSSGSQIEEPTGPGATSKFLQKWQIDFEPLFTPFLCIPHQNQPHSDLRHTLKYRFLKFWLKTVKSSYVFGRSKRRGVFAPPCGAPWVSKIGPWGSKIGPWGSKIDPWGSKSVPGGVLGGPWGVPGGFLEIPGGSWEAPGGLPEDFRDSGRPSERSKGVPEDHFG